MRADAPILLFDSGVGGLSVLACVRRVLPAAPVVYVADNGFYPYGTRSEAEIAARVPALLGRLVERYRPRLVAIPCNTASTIALPVIRAALDVPVVGTVPAIKPAAARSRSRAVGVLGTHATVRQPYVERLVGEFAADCLVLRYGSAALVDAAEAKLRGAPPDAALVARELAGLLEQPGGERVDTVVLACTHFPLLAEELSAAAPHIAFVDSGDGIARRVAHLLEGQAFAGGQPDRAVFTAAAEVASTFRAALASYGLEDILIF
jgi:glutamate racemase